MAAAVGFRSGLTRNRTGSLSELNHSRPTTCRSLRDQLGQCSPSGFLSWHDGESNLSEHDLVVSTRDVAQSLVSSSSISTPLIKLHRFLCAIHSSLRNGHKSSKVVQQERNSPSLSPARNDHLRSTYLDYLTSAGNLIGSLFDDNLEHTFLHPRKSYFSSDIKRRNSNSESDLSWSSLDNLNTFLAEPVVSQPCRIDVTVHEISQENRNTYTSLDVWTNSKESCATGSTFDILHTAVQNENAQVTDNSRTEEQTTILEDKIPDVLQTPSAETAESFMSENCICLFPSFHEDEKCGTSRPIVNEIAQFTETSNILEVGVDEAHSSVDVEVSQSLSKLQKSVLFADEVGRSLTETYIFQREDSFKSCADYDSLTGGATYTKHSGAVPLAASRLKKCTSMLNKASTVSKVLTDCSANLRVPTESTRTVWFSMFTQPASRYYEFRQRLENNSVSLESISITTPDDKSHCPLPRLSGTIKVKNISFEKQVLIRLTTDQWQSYTDHMALYSPQLSTGMLHSASRFDTFSFNLAVVHQLESTQTCDKIEFAVRYMAGPDGSWGQYWDNNNGQNYVIERRVMQPMWSSKQPQSVHYAAGVTLEMKAFDNFENTDATHLRPYTPDYRPNFERFKQFTDYRAWDHFSGETTYY